MQDESKVSLRFYGRRKSHKLRDYQQGLYDNLLPQIAVQPDQIGGAGGGGLAAGFGAGDVKSDYWLEIGFGGGEHLVAQAIAHPEIGLIGCDMFLNGIAQALRQIDQAKISNIRIFEGDARVLLAVLPSASLSRVFILFPDPWPKKRHHRRRIVNSSVLDQVARALKPGGELRLATDDLSYLPAMLHAAVGHPEFHWLARQASDWQKPPQDWVPTRYQKKAERAGRIPYFLCFRRV